MRRLFTEEIYLMSLRGEYKAFKSLGAVTPLTDSLKKWAHHMLKILGPTNGKRYAAWLEKKKASKQANK
jgi:hypothetical protein